MLPVMFDWNELGPRRLTHGAEVLDETLRDGLQSASARHPSLAEKMDLLHCMAGLPIHAVNLGIPASSPRSFDDAVALASEATAARLPLTLVCAGRTLASDVAAMLDVCQRTGAPIEAHTFIGASPIRSYTEGWDLERLLRNTRQAVAMAARGGVPVTYVTEDTTRSRPDVLQALFSCALEAGATRLCLADTVGHATPHGARQLVSFTRTFLRERGVPGVRLDWHGHDDRGLALSNALAAIEAGVDRVHATALGLGERTGNTAMELLLSHVAWANGPPEPSDLARYCWLAAKAVGAVHAHVSAPPQRRRAA
jgi:2-isopropylmalate synthase